MGHSGNQLHLELDHTLAARITHAVNETLSTMTGVTPIPDSHRVEANPTVHADISGIVTLVQDRVEGVLVVPFPKQTIFHILARIFQQQYSEINRPVQDSVGEFTNIIYCMIKANLNNNGYRYQMSLPSVVIGDQHKVFSAGGGQALVSPFDFAGHPFHVILQLQAHALKRAT